MVKQLLHVPTVRARELAANGQQEHYIAGLEALYGITVDQPASAPAPGAECPAGHDSGGLPRDERHSA
jgi:glutamyl-tRNA reductase